MSTTKVNVDVPDHPLPTDMAETLLDLDEGLGTVRQFGHFLWPSLEDRRMIEQLITGLLPLLRFACAWGIAAERRRYAVYLGSLAERAAKNGAPTRAKALADLAADLMKAAVWPEVKA